MARADHYTAVPTKTSKVNTIFRIDLVECARSNPELQAALRRMCKEDFFFFVSAFVWQYNPHKEEIAPFLPWACQERAVYKEPGVPWPGEDPEDIDDAGLMWCIRNKKALLIQKSRDMGISWLCLLVFVWYFLFYRNQEFLCISRNEYYVDSPSSKSLFWKIDCVLRHLPDWLLPKGGITRTKNYFGNHELNCSITGEPSKGDSGVGGRVKAMLIDEFSMINEDVQVRERTAGTAGCRIFNGTHRGMDTEFYALSQNPEIRKLTIHWTQHPDKIAGLYRSGQPVEVFDKQHVYPENYTFVMDGSPVGGVRPGIRSPWYDNMCVEIGSTSGAAMELDVNPSGSVSQFFEPLVIRDLIQKYCMPPVWEGDVSEDGKLVRYPGGPVKMWKSPISIALPEPGRYGAGIDISMGTGASLSCLSIGNADTGEKILEFSTPNMNPGAFAKFCVRLFSLFKDGSGERCLVAWEKNGPTGWMFADTVKALGYRRCWHDKDELSPVRPWKEQDAPGWYCSNTSKTVLMEEYRLALRKNDFLNRSEPALKECLAWKWTKNGQAVYGKPVDNPSGEGMLHGDLTIADALCWKMMKELGQSIRKKQEEETPLLSRKWREQYHDNLRRQQGRWVS
jgi:hypothetical protein